MERAGLNDAMHWIVYLALVVAAAPLYIDAGLEIFEATCESTAALFGATLGITLLAVAASWCTNDLQMSYWKRTTIRALIAIPLLSVAICMGRIGLFWTWTSFSLLLPCTLLFLVSTSTATTEKLSCKSVALVGGSFIILSAIAPNVIGRSLGTIGTLFALLGAWLLVLGVILRSSYKRWIATSCAISLCLTLAFSRTHDVRLLEDPKLLAHSSTPLCPKLISVGGIASLEETLDCWLANHPAPDGQATVVLVATAGGGARAAEWTADVLARLDHAISNFSDHVLAISSVAGGSVGAATYVASTREREAGRKCRGVLEISDIQPCVRHALKGHALAALIASWLSSDVITSVVGPTSWFLPDRQTALEKGWEDAWTKTYDDHLIGESFGFFFLMRPWPALYI